MKKITALLSLTVLGSMAPLADRGGPSLFGGGWAWAAAQEAAGQKPTTWSSRDEYDAYMAFAGEQDPKKRIALGDAFLQKFPNTFMKETTLAVMMQTYAQLNDTDKAIETAHKVLQSNPNQLDALAYLSFVFPFTFQVDDPQTTSKLSQAENNARRGLEALQKVQKPEAATQQQFDEYIKGQRANFNACMGFVALQRKDYPAAVTYFKAAAEDNPADIYTFYRLGIAYISGEPRDFNNAIWSLARSVSLAKAANNPAAEEIDRYLRKVYINYHGNEEGLEGILAQAAASPTPPAGFTVSQMQIPEDTGNASVDAFNKTFFLLRYGGERAQKLWDNLKGQPFGVGGFIESVDKEEDSDMYSVKIDILDQSKAEDGVYDIDLRDSTQPNVRNLAKGDAVHFQGVIGSYTATPNLVITLDEGTINDDELPDRPRRPRPKAKG